MEMYMALKFTIRFYIPLPDSVCADVQPVPLVDEDEEYFGAVLVKKDEQEEIVGINSKQTKAKLTYRQQVEQEKARLAAELKAKRAKKQAAKEILAALSDSEDGVAIKKEKRRRSEVMEVESSSESDFPTFEPETEIDEDGFLAEGDNYGGSSFSSSSSGFDDDDDIGTDDEYDTDVVPLSPTF